MGDVGDDYNAMKEHGREKRAENRVSSAEILNQHSIKFQSKNCGAHLIVRHNGHNVNFWPGTGKWIACNSDNDGRGVYGLIKLISEANNG
jgi:hypothetical protein